MKYRKKPIIVEAVKFHYWINPYGKWEAVEYINGVRKAKTISEKFRDWWKGFSHYYIDTLEGTLIVCNGDYIIKGIKGEFYPCKPDIFEASYDKVEE